MKKINGVAVISEAEYPVTYKYPLYENFFDKDGECDFQKYQKALDKYDEQSKVRREAAEKLDGSADKFYRFSAEEFLSETKKNAAYSPVSLYMALAMLAETSDGNSRRQILELLDSEDISALRSQAKNTWNAVYRDDGTTAVVPANSLWLDNGINAESAAADILAKEYYTAVFQGDMGSDKMNDALHKWLNAQTKGLLKEAADNTSFSEYALMGLYSAVYFHGKWNNEFYLDSNDKKIFHGINGDKKTEFMNNSDNYCAYCQSKDWCAIALPFETGGSMWFILPDKEKSTDDLLISGEYLELLKNGNKNRKQLAVNYSIPKFDISSEIMLGDGLKNLGIKDVFDSGKADFSPIAGKTEGLFVSDAKHAARVVIDEEGCTAAAFTEAVIAAMSLPPEEKIDFILDRPFLFIIKSDMGQPLFIGRINDPTEK